MSAWCGRRDSNPHNFRHWNLNPARLPVPPRPREKHPIRPRCRERRAYNMSPPVRSKKMALFDSLPGQGVTAGQIPQKMVRIGPMASPKSLLDRRELMAGLGGGRPRPGLACDGLGPGAPRAGAAGQSRQPCAPPGRPATPIWSLRRAGTPIQARRHRRGRLRQRATGTRGPQLAGNGRRSRAPNR